MDMRFLLKEDKMDRITKEVYEQIKNDIPKIDDQMSSRNGSERLWKKLRSKYSVLLPGTDKHVQESGKVTSAGTEFDFRPELEQLKEVILAYMIVNPVDEQSNVEIKNEGKELLNKILPTSTDNLINEKIEESKLYIRSKESNKKQTALEKIWDAFERLKTIYGEDKKTSVEKLIDTISNGSIATKKLLDKEFKELTEIGNNFQIRHFENGKEPLESDDFREYLYFRILSLISYSLYKIK